MEDVVMLSIPTSIRNFQEALLDGFFIFLYFSINCPNLNLQNNRREGMELKNVRSKYIN